MPCAARRPPYTRLATAAHNGNRSAYRRAADSVRRAESDVAADLEALGEPPRRRLASRLSFADHPSTPSAIRSAASGRATARAALAISASRWGAPRSVPVSRARRGPSSSSSGTTTAAPAASM